MPWIAWLDPIRVELNVRMLMRMRKTFQLSQPLVCAGVLAVECGGSVGHLNILAHQAELVPTS
ncbi:hypothetical protein [Amycolatopsis magusensis]|uniref:Uncharacterized protein n=1 Tax=Amycolatopsis magusensis TaxID=882444 RepID=A0ABS4PU73_9PSEU|nr:hypothetical protein [Amycolatopsis magusensis]MBP2182974.1 hypothetical protein [Amycolatopsis magusensis]